MKRFLTLLFLCGFNYIYAISPTDIVTSIVGDGNNGIFFTTTKGAGYFNMISHNWMDLGIESPVNQLFPTSQGIFAIHSQVAISDKEIYSFFNKEWITIYNVESTSVIEASITVGESLYISINNQGSSSSRLLNCSLQQCNYIAANNVDNSTITALYPYNGGILVGTLLGNLLYYKDNNWSYFPDFPYSGSWITQILVDRNNIVYVTDKIGSIYKHDQTWTTIIQYNEPGKIQIDQNNNLYFSIVNQGTLIYANSHWSSVPMPNLLAPSLSNAYADYSNLIINNEGDIWTIPYQNGVTPILLPLALYRYTGGKVWYSYSYTP